MSTIGLIAGSGRFPLLFAESARRAGHRVVAAAHQGVTDPALAGAVDACAWVKLGQLGRIVAALRGEGATCSVMLGAVPKVRFFKDALPDAALLKVVARVAVRGDDSVLRAVADHLGAEGLPVVDPTPYLADRLAPAGRLGKREPTGEQWLDARYGLELARAVGRLDLGQTVVVKGRVALAVEAIEGTDACIRRGGALAKAGAVVVKAVKPGQDRRFDLPAVGPDTVAVLAEVGAAALAVEAGATLVMDREELVRQADRAGIAVVGI
ncbi:MAG TPA: UDP-2,3-diacylglucosamine diphosphatase LpxI [Anaeromyxobacteraceae bacterium]|nr:UDP-2,3-diacylglucosamine diphosphatase LpxI [Anaeromyxobacteraceae bacterium]